MAAGTKLVLTYDNASGGAVSFTFNYADSAAEASDVRALVNGIITNNAVFENAPVTAKSAKLVTTTETEIPLSA
ncbi:MAG: DUF2922 family protein [Synergistaceae bacterium]|nr:DUF2922 family protein [Synergistaceae bacterium]